MHRQLQLVQEPDATVPLPEAGMIFGNSSAGLVK